MMINGVNGKSDYPVTDPAVTAAPKEEADAAVKTDVTVDSIPAPEDNGYITYTGDGMQEKTEEKQKEDPSEDGRQDNTSDRMTKEDYKEIGEEGISLEKYDGERLARALDRIKSQRTAKEENLTEQKKNLQNKTEAIEKMADYSTATKKIVQKLEEAGLPVTEANIARIATAMELASGALKLSDKAMNYLIKNKLEPTIENLYKARYSGSYTTGTEKMSEEVFKSLLGQVNEVIDNAGLKINDETVDSAKWLLNNRLPLTENTLWAYRDLNQLKNIDEDTVLDRAVEAFAAGKNPEAASLGIVGTDRAKLAMDNFSSISGEAVKEAVKTHEAGRINGRVLRKIKRQPDLQTKDTDKKQPDFLKEAGTFDSEDQSDFDIKTITVRRQLEEIRLKMTLDSGQELIKKGFNLDTDSLSKIVDGLRELEDKYYKNLLKEGKADISTENAELLKKSMDSVSELKTMPNYILGSTLSSRNIESVNSLLTAGTTLKSTLDKAGEAYESLMTKPRSDMGDSIAKAFLNVDDILEDMKLEATQANERAVRILGYNGMDISDDNIQYVKSYDEQVNRLMKNLQPAVTVELIKKGINPLNMPIEELNRQIEGIQKELGTTENEKYSKYLWKLEKNNNITEADKKSYIGVYRLLNAVEKTDGAALGAVLKSDRDVTLKNLLTAVRTMKSGRVDAAVDDGFGSISQFNPVGESITDQLNTSFLQTAGTGRDTGETGEKSEKFRYMDQLIKAVREEISPDKLENLANTEDILNMSVEKLKEELNRLPEDEETDNAYWGQKLDEYLEATGQSENARRLLNNYDMPTSLPNILAAKDYLSTDNSFYKQLNRLFKSSSDTGDTGNENADLPADSLSEISDGLVDALTGPAGMKERYRAFNQNVEEFLEHLTDNPVITSRDMETVRRIRYGMSFIQNLASKESYEIPLATGDTVTSVNVTILRNTGESGKVNINMDSGTLGNISVSLSVKEKGVNALITCDNRDGLDALKDRGQELGKAISGSGIEIKQLNYGIGNKKADTYRYTNYNPDREIIESGNPDTGDVSTDTLYSLAKTFLVHIKQTENDLNNA